MSSGDLILPGNTSATIVPAEDLPIDTLCTRWDQRFGVPPPPLAAGAAGGVGGNRRFRRRTRGGTKTPGIVSQNLCVLGGGGGSDTGTLIEWVDMHYA